MKRRCQGVFKWKKIKIDEARVKVRDTRGSEKSKNDNCMKIQEVIKAIRQSKKIIQKK